LHLAFCRNDHRFGLVVAFEPSRPGESISSRGHGLGGHGFDGSASLPLLAASLQHLHRFSTQNDLQHRGIHQHGGRGCLLPRCGHSHLMTAACDKDERLQSSAPYTTRAPPHSSPTSRVHEPCAARSRCPCELIAAARACDLMERSVSRQLSPALEQHAHGTARRPRGVEALRRRRCCQQLSHMLLNRRNLYEGNSVGVG
jgi:hypothetical protein